MTELTRSLRVQHQFALFIKEKITIHRNENILHTGFCLAELSLQELVSSRLEYLHPKEYKYYSTLQHDKRRHSYLLGRYCSKHALGKLIGLQQSNEIFIDSGVFNQPIVTSMLPNNIQVSISHCDNAGVAIAFHESHPMAIDIERTDIDRSMAFNIDQLMTYNELKLISSFINDENLRMVILWSIKEALSKVIKCGLTIPLELLEINHCRKESTDLIVEFKNFLQYKCIIKMIDKYVCTIVLPKNSVMKNHNLLNQ